MKNNCENYCRQGLTIHSLYHCILKNHVDFSLIIELCIYEKNEPAVILSGKK